MIIYFWCSNTMLRCKCVEMFWLRNTFLSVPTLVKTLLWWAQWSPLLQISWFLHIHQSTALLCCYKLIQLVTVSGISASTIIYTEWVISMDVESIMQWKQRIEFVRKQTSKSYTAFPLLSISTTSTHMQPQALIFYTQPVSESLLYAAVVSITLPLLLVL